MSKQILVVDDEPNVRLNYRVTLETGDFTVLEAASGERALELLATHAFDLAILDLRMPHMGGLELLAEMRKRGDTTPSVIITAYGDVPDAVRAMKLGAIDFLKKPLTPEQLRQIAHEVIARHEQSMELAPGTPDELSAEDLYERYLTTAKRLLNEQDFEPARVQLAKAMAIDPLSAEAFNLAGVLFEMQGDTERATQHYNQALKLDAHREAARDNLARILGRPARTENPGSSGGPL